MSRVDVLEGLERRKVDGLVERREEAHVRVVGVGVGEGGCVGVGGLLRLALEGEGRNVGGDGFGGRHSEQLKARLKKAGETEQAAEVLRSGGGRLRG